MQPNSIALTQQYPDPPAGPGARAFWRWQIAGWFIYGVAMYLAASQQLPPLDALVNKSVNTALGFALSLGLRSIYLRLRARALPPTALLPILAACCWAAGGSWSVLANSAYWWYRDLDFAAMPITSFFTWTLMHAFVLLAWCAIYVSSQLYDDLRKLRARPETRQSAPLVVRTDGGTVRIAQSEIVCIEAARNYSCIVCDAQVHVVRSTLNTLGSRLDTDRFLRVHRSTIVAVNRLVQLRALPGNDAVATLAGGREVRVSRRFRADVENALGR